MDIIAMLDAIKAHGYSMTYDWLRSWYKCFYEEEKVQSNDGWMYFLECLKERYQDIVG